MHGARADVAFDDLADRAQRFARRRAGGEREAEAAVARLVVGAGQHEVAHAGEAHERLLAAAEREPQARHLGEAARDQRDARVRAEAEAVADAGADRVDVLRRAADLDADDVVRGVGAKRFAADALGEPLRVVRRRVDAIVMAVGSPAPTSRANVGPESTAVGRLAGSSWPATW